MMPMSAQVGFVLRDNDQVKGSRFNEAVAARARITFARRVRLDRADDLV